MKHTRILQSLPILAALAGITALTPAVSSAEEHEVLQPVTPTIAPVYSKIRIETKPDKLVYRAGETLDLTGLTVITSVCKEGEWEPEVSGQELTPQNGFQIIEPDLSGIGIKSVLIQFIPPNVADFQGTAESEADFAVIVTGPGDLDVNGTLDTNDIKIMDSVLHGKVSLTGDAAVNADMNSDGEIDAFDLALMKRNLRRNVKEYMDLTPTVKADLTADAGETEWANACKPDSKNTFVISSAGELKQHCRSWRAAVQRSLLNTYDDAFFQKNILLLHLTPYDHDQEILTFSDLSYKNGNLTVTVARQAQEELSERCIQIWQIALPREQYNDKDVVWTEQDTVYYTGTFSETMCMNVPEETYSKLKQGVLVTSAEEDIKLMTAVFGTDETAAKDPAFFEKNAIFYRIDDKIYGDKTNLWQIRRTGDRVTVDTQTKMSSDDEAFPMLERLALPKEAVTGDPEITIRSVSHPFWLTTSGTICYFESEQGTLAVNQYHFGDEYETAFYWVYPRGIARYAEYRLIKSEAVSADASVFKEYDGKGAHITKDDAEGYSIEWGETGVTVTFLKSKSDGKQTVVHFPYQDR